MASQSSHGSKEAEERLHAADYVEARGLLLPAVDYLQRAVVQATSQNLLSGVLLVTVSPPVVSNLCPVLRVIHRQLKRT